MELVTYEDLLKKPDVHSALGPSSSERWLECPGSVGLCKGLPDAPTIYADEGNFYHDVSELCRLNNVPAKTYIGLVSVCERFTVTEETARYVQSFVDYVNQFEGDMMVEELVTYDAWVPGGFGTLDDGRIRDGVCNLTDLKFGQGVKVFCKGNTQMWMYGLGVFQDYGHLYDIETFKFNIHQPRLDHIDEDTVSLKEILLWARDVVQPTAKIALGDDAPFQPGEWCRFCKARDTCVPRKQWLMAQMLDELDDMDSIKDPDLMTNDDLANAMDVLSLMRSWCNDIEARVLSEVQAGRAVGTPSWKLVAGRSNRAWRNAKKAEAALRKVSRLKVSDIFKQTMISPTQAEKLLGKDHAIMTDHVRKPPGSPKLAPPTDPRPAVVADISELDDDDEAPSAGEE
jgi:hypothetical protein